MIIESLQTVLGIDSSLCKEDDSSADADGIAWLSALLSALDESGGAGCEEEAEGDVQTGSGMVLPDLPGAGEEVIVLLDLMRSAKAAGATGDSSNSDHPEDQVLVKPIPEHDIRRASSPPMRDGDAWNRLAFLVKEQLADLATKPEEGYQTGSKGSEEIPTDASHGKRGSEVETLSIHPQEGEVIGEKRELVRRTHRVRAEDAADASRAPLPHDEDRPLESRDRDAMYRLRSSTSDAEGSEKASHVAKDASEGRIVTTENAREGREFARTGEDTEVAKQRTGARRSASLGDEPDVLVSPRDPARAAGQAVRPGDEATPVRGETARIQELALNHAQRTSRSAVTLRVSTEENTPLMIRLRADGEHLSGQMQTMDPVLLRNMSGGAQDLQRSLEDLGFNRVDLGFGDESPDPHPGSQNEGRPGYGYRGKADSAHTPTKNVDVDEAAARGLHPGSRGLDLLI